MKIKQINKIPLNDQFNIEHGLVHKFASNQFSDCKLLDVVLYFIKPQSGNLHREAYNKKEIAMMIASILISFGLPISYALYHTKVLREELNSRPDIISKGKELVQSKSPEIQAQIEKIIDQINNGQFLLTQEELHNNTNTLENKNDIQKKTYQSCEITYEIVNAVIALEYDPNKNVSSEGATGLMQLMPKTWEEINQKQFGGKYPFQTYARNDIINKMFGTAYLKTIKKYLDSHQAEWKTDELPLIFACYFGGIGNVRKAEFDPAKIKTKLPLTHDYMVRGSNLSGYNSDNL